MVTQMTNAITIKNLTKYYGKQKGVENISLTVEKGTIHGFLGPNGAGKTTTLRLLVGLIKKNSGEIKIFDYDAGTVDANRIIGYLPSEFELYPYYTVGEYLDYIEKLVGDAPLRSKYVDIFQLDENRKTSELSRGNKQKVAIVQALMHDPDIIIADEPTSGLDPLMQEVFANSIQDFVKSDNKTAFISSHILSEVQHLCDYVTIIRDGSIISSGKINELLASMPKKAILQIKSEINGNDIAKQTNTILKSQTGNTITLLFDDMPDFLQKISELNNILDFYIPPPSLDEYFMTYYRS